MNMRMIRTAKRTAPITRLYDNAMIDFDTIARDLGITREEVITRILRQMDFYVAALQRKANALTTGVNA